MSLRGPKGLVRAVCSVCCISSLHRRIHEVCFGYLIVFIIAANASAEIQVDTVAWQKPVWRTAEDL